MRANVSIRREAIPIANGNRSDEKERERERHLLGTMSQLRFIANIIEPKSSSCSEAEKSASQATFTAANELSLSLSRVESLVCRRNKPN